MLKNLSKLEIVIADKIYQFICDPDSPIEHCKEALFQCLKYIGKIEDSAKNSAEDLKDDNKPPEVLVD